MRAAQAGVHSENAATSGCERVHTHTCRTHTHTHTHTRRTQKEDMQLWQHIGWASESPARLAAGQVLTRLKQLELHQRVRHLHGHHVTQHGAPVERRLVAQQHRARRVRRRQRVAVHPHRHVRGGAILADFTERHKGRVAHQELQRRHARRRGSLQQERLEYGSAWFGGYRSAMWTVWSSHAAREVMCRYVPPYTSRYSSSSKPAPPVAAWP